MNTRMLLRTLALALVCTGVASAAATPIQDGAGMFSASTVSTLDQEISNFTAQTGKQIVVVTVDSLNGKPLSDAAEAVFTQQNVNGMLIFIAKDDRKDIFVPDTATAQFFPEPTIASIRQSMEGLFKAEDYDGGITSAVGGVLNVFRAHLNSAPANGAANSSYNYPAQTTTRHLARHYTGGISHVWTWIILIVIGYFVLRSIFRAMRGPRYYGGGPGMPPGPGGPGYGGPGYGGYGYGPGYYGGGGGGFWSGLLGGLGGAWLGNEMFGNRGTTIVDQQGGNIVPGGDQGGSWGGGDAGGWANNAGQADMGGSSGGDWGGGGFGGGGDFGGGGFGGGDSGGGGGW